MEDRLYIDGKDVYSEYGVYVVQAGWNDLISYPPLKNVDKNDWQELDGEEPDLSAPVLDSREVQIKFAISGVFSRFEAFVALLSNKAYHIFNCASIGREYKLRLISNPNFDEALSLGFITLRFADDFPLRNYQYLAPESSITPYNDYKIDNKMFTAYGARILKGTLSSVRKASEIKKNLMQNSKFTAGANYDDERVTYKAKDVKLNILMRASSLTELWRNYDALLYDLTRAGEHKLFVNVLRQEFPCYYKSAKVNEFYPTDKLWLHFTITLRFIK